MSNPERDPQPVRATSSTSSGPEVMTPRDVPLGGIRAMTVRRTLPQRGRSLIGAWCFLDHYGPDAVTDTGGMSVAPHPHAGLQTVSWLFAGEVEHRDSGGHHAIVRAGELNLMTAGHGISHSEISTAAATTLHGVQLWVALPDDVRDGDRRFEHYVPEPVSGEGWTARVFLGSLLGRTSPVGTATPLLGAELSLASGSPLELDVDPSYEHGVLLDSGTASVGGLRAEPHELVYLPPGSSRLTLEPHDDCRLLLLGGPPFGAPIVMWWNFVGRSHEEIAAMRVDWQAQLAGAGAGAGQGYVDGRFGIPVGDTLAPIPAPTLPNVRLKERR